MMTDPSLEPSTAMKTCSAIPKRLTLCSLPMWNFWFSCLCILVAYFFLAGFISQDTKTITISIGLLAFVPLTLHLVLRDVFREPFHPDILLTIGHLAQFVVPILIFATGLFDDVISEHAAWTRTHFPHAILGALIAQTAFNLPFCILPPRRRSLSASRGKHISIFILLMGIGVWSARLALIANKAYYYHFGSTFVNTSFFYSPLAVVSTLGRIVTIYAALIIFSKKSKRAKIFPISYLLLEFSWHLFSGKREGLLIAVLCIIMAYILIRKKIPAFYCLMFIVILFVSSAFYHIYRDVIIATPDIDNISVLEAAEEALRSKNYSNTKKAANVVMDRLNDGQFAAGCFKTMPDIKPFLGCESYKMILWIPVPRVLYHARPKFMLNYNLMIKDNYTSLGSAPVTTVGEAYINSGWIAIPVVFLILGLIYRVSDSVFRSEVSLAEAAVLIFFCLLIVRMQVNPVVSHLSWMLKVFILLLICRVIESKPWQRMKAKGESLN